MKQSTHRILTTHTGSLPRPADVQQMLEAQDRDEQIDRAAFEARPAGLSFEGANPRHEHEWKVFEQVKLPAGKVLIPGVLDSTTNFIEHPELVAQRLERYASVVGRENVIAGTDCGFATFAGSLPVDPDIAWAKLASMVEGAQIASGRLW